MRRLLLILLSAACLQATAQKADSVDVIRDASSLSSGNTRDVLASFFQIAYQDLSSDKKEFNFAANLFAIALKRDPSLNIDRKYIRNPFLRNSNVSFSIRVDSSIHFDGIKLGYKYALINNRDYTVSQAFLAETLQRTSNIIQALQMMGRIIATEYNGDPAMIDEIDKFFNGQLNYNQLSANSKGLADRFFSPAKNDLGDSWNPRQSLDSLYGEVVKSFKKKLLWTAAANYNTNYGESEKGSFNLETEVLQGFKGFNEKVNLELSAKATYVMSDDTLKAESDLKRRVIGTEGAVNFVFRNRAAESVFEWKLATSYNVTLSDGYENEDMKRFVFGSTVRFRLFGLVWIPVDIKYDPKNSNWYGGLSIKANFDGLKNAFGNN